MRCGDCAWWSSWANRETGECHLKLPPFVQVKPTATTIDGERFTTRHTDGCSLGKRK